MSQSPNRTLNALPARGLCGHKTPLKPMKLSFAEVVAETDQSIRQEYFPFSGAVSLVVDMSGGEMIERAMVGRSRGRPTRKISRKHA